MSGKIENKARAINPKKEQTPRAEIFQFENVAQAQEYLEWKRSVPEEFRLLVEGVMRNGKAPEIKTSKPLTDSFLKKIGESLEARNVADLADCDKRVANMLSPLKKVGTQGGYLNVFETLASPVTSWDLKRQIYKTQIESALEWLIGKDLEELTKRELEKSERSEREKQEDGDLPLEQDEAISSMEAGPQEKKEGEPARPLFLVKPFFGGYASDKEFDELGADFRWRKTTKDEFFEFKHGEYDLAKAKIISGKIRGKSTLALPIFDNWTIDPNFIETNAPEGTVKILRNQQGKFYLRINTDGIFRYAVRIAPRLTLEEREKPESLKIGGDLPEELKKIVEELVKKRLPKIKLKREIAKLVRSHLAYSNSREAWDHYTAAGGVDFFKKVWQRKEADCFTANTLAARAMAEVDGDTVLVGGYYIKEKDAQGNAIMHSGNGHGWLKVWDELSQRLVRLDATPKGDPNVDEEQQEKELEGEETGGEGDYGGEDEIASEEEVKEQIRKMQKKTDDEGGGGGKKEKRLDLEAQKFAEEAGCTERQAEEFLVALERVRKIKDENGNSISDLIKEEWRKVIEERIVKISRYKGPVRMDEGDRLESPVEAMIDIRAGEYNPTGFEKQAIIEKREYDFGGLNLFFSFDLSGSMGEPDPASGRAKADVQRDAALLFIDGLMQCAYTNRQNVGESGLLPLKIMATLASSSGQLSLPLTDKWGSKEQWAFYSALIKTASGGTPTHETLHLIEEALKKETAELKKKNLPKEKMPANYVAVISDGEPDNFSASEQASDDLAALGAKVRGYIIGSPLASKYAAEPLASFSDLPRILSKDIVELMKAVRSRK